MYVSLYRKYRPQTFSDMVGQSAAVGVLQESLREGRLGHAYLFSGPRGCGKTSAARLVAKSLNCLHPKDGCEPCGECQNCVGIAAGEHLDVIEIDGASNRGIGEIRDLKSHVNLKPLSSAYKVYIIDEVHMLTEAAFNALLKTLEEPPANVVFLLATTKPHKVPVTIRSRCQHIPFHRISIEDMVKRLAYVCSAENISCESEALWELARQADGALRDALSLAEQAISLGRGCLTLESVKELTGGSNRTDLEKWVAALHAAPSAAAAELQTMLARGISLERLTESLFAVFRDLWMFSAWGSKAADAMELSASKREYLTNEAPRWKRESLREACLLCNSLLPRTRYGMRIEVYSGLLMLQLSRILEGRTSASAQAVLVEPKFNADTQKAPDAPVVSTTRPQQAADKAKAQSRTHDQIQISMQGPQAAAEPDLVAAPQPQISVETGSSDFSQLVAALEGDRLAIAAALLHCRLIRTPDGWKTEFAEHCPAEVFLESPRAKAILAAAVEKIWKINSADTPPSQPDQTPAPAFAVNLQTQQRSTAPTSQEAPPQNPAVDGGLDRLLKLMGAEILYIDDHEGSEEEGQEGME